MASSFNYANWMSGVAGDISLGDLAIPGTHNSGANYLSLDNGISLADIVKPYVWDAPFDIGKDFVNFIRKDVDPIIDAVIGFYALNTESSITEQLNSGIRCFDLRFDYDRDTDAMYVAHGTVKYSRNKLDLIMQELEAWIAAHPSETILIKPRIYNNPSDAQLQKYFYDRYVYALGTSPNKALRRHEATSLRNNPSTSADSQESPLIGEEIYYRSSQLPSLQQARGKLVLLDGLMIQGLKDANLWGAEQDYWDTSSLRGGVNEKIEKIKQTLIAISEVGPNKLSQNHFQLSPGAPKFDDFLPRNAWDLVDFIKKAINEPEEFIKNLVNRIFAPLTPPLGLAAQLNGSTKDLLDSLPNGTRTKGLWVGDFTNGSSDFFDGGIKAITDYLSLPEDTSTLSTVDRIKVNVIQTIAESLKKENKLQAADVTDAIIRRNLSTVLSLSRESLREGGSTELQIGLFDPATTSTYFRLSPASAGATKEDILLSLGSSSTTGYTLTASGDSWTGSVDRNASGHITLTALSNNDAEEINESFKIELYRDSNLKDKIGDAVTFTISPGSSKEEGGKNAYVIHLKLSDAPWAGSGDEGNSSVRAPSTITLTLSGINEQGQRIDKQVVLGRDSFDRSINNNRKLPFERGAADRFQFLLDDALTSIQSVTIQANQANKDRIDLSSLTIDRLNPVSENSNIQRPLNLFHLNTKTDPFKVTSKSGNTSASRYLYKTGLTPEKAFRIDKADPIALEPVSYLGGSNQRIATPKGDVWLHVLDGNGERTPISATELDPKLPTFIITHGFTGGLGDKWLANNLPTFSTTATNWKLDPKDLLQWQTFYGDDHALALSVQEAYRDQNKKVQANVILADWGNFSAIGDSAASYASYAKVAEEHVPAAGRAIAEYIKQQGIDPGKVTLLGHSLGSHVMAFAGQAIQEDAKANPNNYVGKAQQIGAIVAMDAAGPMFETWAPDKRLSNGDATKVIAIHTDTLMGFDAPLGTHDLYMDASYTIAHSQSGITSEAFRSKLETLYRDVEALYASGKTEEAKAKYLTEGLALTWDPSFTWYQLQTDNPSDKRTFFQKQHNYSMATLANLFLEDKRLSTPDFQLPSWLGGQNATGLKDPNASLWTQTFKTQLEAFRSRNNELKANAQAATFSSLLKGNEQGGLFSGVQALSWNAGANQNWENFPSAFLKPDVSTMGSTTIPFSDYTYFWNDTGKNIDSLAAAEITKALEGKSNSLGIPFNDIVKDVAKGSSSSLQWSGLDFYNRYLSPDFGLADGTVTALGGTGFLDMVGAAALTKTSNIYTKTYNGVSSTMNAIYGLKQQIFGGPVVNGEVVLDLRSYKEDGSGISSNLNLNYNDGEIVAKTDATGSFVLANLPDPRMVGNRDGTLDYRDGMVIAGSRTSSGFFSLFDSISGTDYEFPLVGLPGGNATLLTTLKYASLLRWRPDWSLGGQPVTPDLITATFAALIKDSPAAFLDDSFNPYSALSAPDPAIRNEGVASLRFAYEHLAVIKVIDALFNPTATGQSGGGLIYDEPALWGRSSGDPLEKDGADQANIVAFTSYGAAIQESFTAAKPFDPANAEHLRQIFVNILASYPTELVLKGQPDSFRQQFALAQTQDSNAEAARVNVKKEIETRLGATLTNLSQGLNTVNTVLRDRFEAAKILSDQVPTVGTQLLIPTIAGPKRFMAETLSQQLLPLAQLHQAPDAFMAAFGALLYTPLTIDAPIRSSNFKLAVSVDDGKSSTQIGGSGATVARFKVQITDSQGVPQMAPDYGLAIRCRLGGSAIEGVDFEVGDDFYHRLLTIQPGTTEATIELPVNPTALLQGNALLQLELLSADSGYVVDSQKAVASIQLGPDASVLSQLTGQRTAFKPHHLISSEAQQEAWLNAAPEENNAVLRGKSGRKDYFVIGARHLGIPHIENFEPSDGDKILFDSAIWAENVDLQFSRDKLSNMVNTYAGYIFDLLSGKPLALISNYSTALGDQAWTGLSSDAAAPYFDIAPTNQSAGVSIVGTGRTLTRGSAVEISLASDINRVLNTEAALELIVIDEAAPQKRQVVMTRPGMAAGLPQGFMGMEKQVGLMGRWSDSARGYKFALRNLATGELADLNAQQPSITDQQNSPSSSLLQLKDQKGVTVATISAYSEDDGSKPASLIDELSHQASGSEPVIAISLARVGNGSGPSSKARTLSVSMDLYRESAFNNRIGLYLADRTTLLPIDKLTGQPVASSSAIGSLLANPDQICTWLGQAVATGSSQVTAEINVPNGASLDNLALLPYLQAGDSNRSVILPMTSLNRDGLSHHRLLGLNTFGFEDWIGPGSDFDMDDVIAKVNTVTVMG